MSRENAPGGGDYDRASSKAFACLGRKALTEAELREKLAGYGFEENVVDDVLDMLIRCNYIDDSRFVLDFIENAMNVKKHGRIRIERDLRGRGVSRELISAAFEHTDTDALAERELAMAIEHLRYRTRGRSDMDDREKKRCFDYLVRRGFTFDTARRAVNDYTGQGLPR